MSTKINSRSPFYITATEPTVAEGAFSCSTAGLSNFSVESNGTIINPNILKGTIIAQDQIEFSALASDGTNTPRTVNYTIRIPDNFTNTTDGTISCPQTFTQLVPTTCVSGNNNMAVFAGTISPLTNVSTGSTVSLGSFFSNGTSATITSYEVLNYQGVAIDAVLTGTVPNQTLTFSTTSTCVSGTFKVRARNSVDACITDSHDFTVASACTKSLHCTTQDATTDAVALSGGAVSSTGVVSIPNYTHTGDLTRVNIKTIAGVSNTTDITSDVKAGNPVSALNNTTGSNREIVLTFRFEVPTGYSNAGAFLDCDDTFEQKATATPELVCTDDFISYHNFSITTTGDILAGTVDVNGVTATYRRSSTNISDGASGFLDVFPKVTSPTARTIKVTFVVPSGFSNATQEKTCDVTGFTQPPTTNPCSATNPNFFISEDSFTAKNGFCDRTKPYSVNDSVTINSSGSTLDDIAAGNIVCRGSASSGFDRVRGGNKYFAVTVNATGSGAGNINASFVVIKINQDGVITELDRAVNCGSDAGNDNII